MNWQEWLLTEPVQEMWTKLLAFVPNLLGALAFLIVGWIFARIIRFLVGRLLRRARFDSLTERAGINQALQQGQITTAPSAIVGKLFYWIVLLLALVMAVNALDLPVATALLSDLARYIPNVIAAAFVLALGLFFGDLVRGFVQTLAAGVRAVKPETIGKLAQAAVIIFAVAAALVQLRVAPNIVTIAFGGFFGALALGLALAFGLGCKDMVKEWVEGLRK